MTQDITLPALAPSMEEGHIVRWLKAPGDPVNVGDSLLEVETDKALVEVEAPVKGILAEIMVREGSVKVDTVIGRMQADESSPSPLSTSPCPPPPSSPAGPSKGSGPGAPGASKSAKEPAAPAAQRLIASPVARRIAHERQIDLATLVGTGPRGRIVRADVESASTPLPAAPKLERDAAACEDIPHSNMRRTIAQRLTASKRDVPHFYLKAACRVDALLQLRQQINADRSGEDRISVNDFLIKAAARAMRQVPEANASWTDTAIRRWQRVDISVAVATDGGLITPVLRDADTKSLGDIAAEVKSLASRARQGRLRPDEYQGGGFTISNLGMHDVDEFSAIVNPPQACILAVGAARQEPVVDEGRLAVATVLRLTLSVDHRAVDGAVGARFLAALKAAVEKPWGMLA